MTVISMVKRIFHRSGSGPNFNPTKKSAKNRPARPTTPAPPIPTDPTRSSLSAFLV